MKLVKLSFLVLLSTATNYAMDAASPLQGVAKLQIITATVTNQMENELVDIYAEHWDDLEKLRLNYIDNIAEGEKKVHEISNKFVDKTFLAFLQKTQNELNKQLFNDVNSSKIQFDENATAGLKELFTMSLTDGLSRGVRISSSAYKKYLESQEKAKNNKK